MHIEALKAYHKGPWSLRFRATDSARLAAYNAGIDLESIFGTGPLGEIVYEDVLDESIRRANPGARPALSLSRELFEQIVQHCRSKLPDMACGLMSGRNSLVRHIHEIRNSYASRDDYAMDPSDLVRALTEIERLGWDVIAIFTSRPDDDGGPSTVDPEDIRWPNNFQVRVPLPLQQRPSLRAYRVAEDRVVEHGVRIR